MKWRKTFVMFMIFLCFHMVIIEFENFIWNFSFSVPTQDASRGIYQWRSKHCDVVSKIAWDIKWRFFPSRTKSKPFIGAHTSRRTRVWWKRPLLWFILPNGRLCYGQIGPHDRPGGAYSVSCPVRCIHDCIFCTDLEACLNRENVFPLKGVLP